MHHEHSDTELADMLMNTKSIAIFGASTRDDRPSYWVTGFLLGKGYKVYPINPNHVGEMLLGQPVLASLDDLPAPVDMIDIFRRKEAFAETVEAILALPWRPAVIWAQLGISDEDAAEKAENAGIKVVMDHGLVTEYPLVYEKMHRH